MRLRPVAAVAAFLVVSLASLAPTAAHDDAEHGMGSAVPNPRDASDATGFAPCVNGLAAGTFPCDGVDMLSRLTLDDLGLSFVNDMWGWTDPVTRRDYALVGGTEGTVVVDITMPLRPHLVGTLPTHVVDPGAPFWRDLKVVDDHMYVVSEEAGHGVQVLDLTQVRDLPRRGDPVTFEETAHYDGLGSAHNIAANEETGFVYVLGAGGDAHCTAGGLHMIDVSDPTSPTFAGCFDDHGYIHDTQCVVYQGPDARYRGREICFNANAPGSYGSPDHYVSIVDVTDKGAPVSLARESYPQTGYSHQGWLTEDQRFFLHGDEGDEATHGIGTTTRVWDVSDLESPHLALTFENDTASVDHNIYTEGRRAYASNYTSGLRVYDTSRLGRAQPSLREIGFFDVYPENDDASFEGGTWSNYPWFRQRSIVAVSSMDRGLFILRPRGHR